jgi:hypothetical protein
MNHPIQSGCNYIVLTNISLAVSHTTREPQDPYRLATSVAPTYTAAKDNLQIPLEGK